MAKTRTFIAVRAADQVHGRALDAIDQLRPSGDNIKWVSPDHLHWTLQFLGDITDEEMAEVCRRAGKVAAQIECFPLVGKSVAAFPDNDRPRTLWLGAGEGSEALCQLQKAIEDDLADMGFRGERRQFVPHLTLGRVGPGKDTQSVITQNLADLADFAGGTMVVEDVTVFASVPQRRGPEYHVLATLPLGG